jgi:nucleoside-diphosphate-sugar epimerase
MKVFVTGVTGFVGAVVVEEFIRHRHKVTGLARSPGSAEKLKQLAAAVHVGSLEDLESLRSGPKTPTELSTALLATNSGNLPKVGRLKSAQSKL